MTMRMTDHVMLAPPADRVPLTPLRVSFTLRHTTTDALLAFVGRQSNWQRGGRAACRETGLETGPDSCHVSMSPDALIELIERDPGFCEWPIKRPVAMTVVMRSALEQDDRSRRMVGFRRMFGRRSVIEVSGVYRDGDRLLQENYVPDWETVAGADERWTTADLAGTQLSIRVVYLSFDDINFRRPPRFQSLLLHFGDTTSCVLGFTDDQLAAPLVYEDPSPLLHGTFFKTLVLEYTFALTPALLTTQLKHLCGPAWIG